jgi:hypothetical protein
LIQINALAAVADQHRASNGRFSMGMLGTAIERWREHREQAAALRALAFMGPEQAQILAADLGLDVGELRYVLSKSAGATALLDRMLRARRLDRHEIAMREPAALREIESMCSRCDNKGRCADELDAGTAVEHASEFCPNALVMAALSRELGETMGIKPA